jgi:hypothetical protein
MEVGIGRPGSHERTLDRRARRKASKERRQKAAEKAVVMTELVMAEGKLPYIPGE